MKEKLLKICELLKGVPAMYATGLRTGATSNLIESQSLLDSIIATLDSPILERKVSMAITSTKHKGTAYYESCDKQKKQQILEDYSNRNVNMNCARAAIGVIKG